MGMWLKLICGYVFFKVIMLLFDDDNDRHIDVEASDFSALFSAAQRLEKLYGGKAYVGLQIPDPDSCSRQNIDIVIVTEREAVVISVKNISGSIAADKDRRWNHLSDPVAEANQLIPILESYLEQRGVALPDGYLSSRVIFPNPMSAIDLASFPPGVITYDQLMQLKPEYKNRLSGWIKGAFSCGKKEMEKSTHEKLNFVLGTAPTLDRLELKGNKCLLGEFLEFKGSRDDIQAMRSIKRSKVSRLEIQKTSMLFDLDFTVPLKVNITVPSTVKVLYWPRDYRGERASAGESKEVNVGPSTEVKFQTQGSTKPRTYELSSVISMSLSA